MDDGPDDLKGFYRRYNEHRCRGLGEFVHEDVQANGRADGLGGYIAGLEAVVAAFPDYR